LVAVESRAVVESEALYVVDAVKSRVVTRVESSTEGIP